MTGSKKYLLSFNPKVFFVEAEIDKFLVVLILSPTTVTEIKHFVYMGKYSTNVINDHFPHLVNKRCVMGVVIRDETQGQMLKDSLSITIVNHPWM